MKRIVSILCLLAICSLAVSAFGQDEGMPSNAGGFFGGSFLANPNLSLILNTFAYASNLKNSELENRGIPGFTTQGAERQKGFNIDAAELVIFAPVAPYFNLYTNIPITDNAISLEEAFVVTTSLPEGFQLKGGKFKSNFSRLDAQHPHAWDFADTFRRSGAQQDSGNAPWRAAGTVEFNPSEFSRIRLQYSNDRSGRGGRENNEWFVQFIFGIGAHAAHSF